MARFKDKRTAEAAKRMALSLEPRYHEQFQPPAIIPQTVRSWIVKLDADIAAYTNYTAAVPSGEVILQIKDPDTHILADLEDPEGDPVTDTAYNLHPHILGATDKDSNKIPYLAHQDIFGDLYVSPLMRKAPYCKFKLSANLATTDASATATIQSQGGPGYEGPTSITVHNLSESGGNYVFQGDTNDWGIALWRSGTDYDIVNMECP